VRRFSRISIDPNNVVLNSTGRCKPTNSIIQQVQSSTVKPLTGIARNVTLLENEGKIEILCNEFNYQKTKEA
jgi:hypothetical protein